MRDTVGLTGGIACGKSTVSRMFGDLGVPVVDADLVAREVAAPGTEGFNRVVSLFGERVLRDGTLDRKALGNLVFNDKAALTSLEAALHPLISERASQLLQEAQKSGVPYVIYENAILVERGCHKDYAALIVVTTDPETQRARLMARNSLTEAEADARISAQLPMSDKVAVADYVIDNSLANQDSLRVRVQELHEKLLQRLAGA